MGGDGMSREALSPRQVAVMGFVSALAPAAAGAGWGWQGTALAAPVAAAAGWTAARLAGRWPALEGRRAGRVCRALCAAWGVFLMAGGLRRTALRLSSTGGGGEGAALWLTLILAAVLIWMSRSSPAAFFRTGEICLLAMYAVLTAVLVWAMFRMKAEWLAQPAVSLGGGFLAALESTGAFLFLIPYTIYYKDAERGPGGGRRGFGWLLAAAGIGALMAGVTAGVLSPGLLPLTEEPFFAMTAALGRSVRVEGLLSALWLIPDLMYLGLMSRSWQRPGRKRDWLPAAGILLAGAAACLLPLEKVPAGIRTGGMAVLWAAFVLALGRGDRK